MTEITHPTIKGQSSTLPSGRESCVPATQFSGNTLLTSRSDGWFREIGDLWPGQAMTLKVNSVLHHEKSKFQDILIFESSDHGTVLVLDDAVQCTENDEFASVFGPAHLPPKYLLIISSGTMR